MGPCGSQQSCPWEQQAVPQQDVPLAQEPLSSSQGGAMHVPPQYEVAPRHRLPQSPQLFGSLNGLTHLPAQHFLVDSHEGLQVPASDAPPPAPAPPPVCEDASLCPSPPVVAPPQAARTATMNVATRDVEDFMTTSLVIVTDGPMLADEPGSMSFATECLGERRIVDLAIRREVPRPKDRGSRAPWKRRQHGRCGER
jgi:hypothetical protein